MEEIVNRCSALSLHTPPKTWYNNSKYSLYAIENEYDSSVYSCEDIVEGDFIGYIEGERKYTWELLPHRYCIWISDSYVLDCRGTPRCITSMIREGIEDHLTPNCEMYFTYTSDSISVCVRSLQHIYRGEELIMKRDCIDDYY